MQKLLLLLLPLAIAACVERDTAPAHSADTPSVETRAAPRAPGRGEGELESRPGATETVRRSDTARSDTASGDTASGDDMPDGSIDGDDSVGGVGETSDVERNRAGSKDAAPADTSAPRVAPFDPTRNPAIIDESGATGFGGRVMSPESLGDGELRNDDNDGSIEPDELPMLPADVVDAGPAMIP